MLGIFLDTETTGLDPVKHSTIDLAFKIIDLCKGQVVASYQTIIKQPKEVWDKKDPGSVMINGYTWEDLLAGKDPQLVANEIISIFQQANIKRNNAVFICQNPAFDKSFFAQLIDVYTQEKLAWPYHWLDLASMYWTAVNKNLKILPEEIILSKNAIAEAYGLKEESEPHHAMGGVNHLILCYKAVLGVQIQESTL